jgi:hypothetical protein
MLEEVKLYLKVYSTIIVPSITATMFFMCKRGTSLAVALLIPIIIYLGTFKKIISPFASLFSIITEARLAYAP